MLGWKYVEAQEESQRYKVGKFILETKRIRGAVDWESGRGNGDILSLGEGEEWGGQEMQMMPPHNRITQQQQQRRQARAANDDEAIEFDSQDEDECEDLFAGVWSPQLALKRRRGRRFGRGNAGNGGGGGPAADRATSQT